MLNRGFFSLQQPWIPTAVALANLVLNAALYAVFYRVGTWGIPFAISLANIAGVGMLLFALRRTIGRIDLSETVRSFVLVTIASVLLGRHELRASGAGSTKRSAARSWRSSSRSASRSLPAAASTWQRAARSGCASWRRYSPCGAAAAEADHAWTRTRSATSRSSPTSTMASRRWPIASCRLTDTVADRDMQEQLLDSMELERERGITIKAQAVRVLWKGHQLNLIDTPGHVDFTYEVSRSLQACEGALLVVDAAQGIEAQTLANAYLAIENNLEIVPVVNKIDLPQADPDAAAAEVADLIGDDPDHVLRISAKTGQGVEDVLDAIVERIPPPDGDPDAPPRALIFDSSYDQYRGVVAFVRVVDGSFSTARARCARWRRERASRRRSSASSRRSDGRCRRSRRARSGYVITGLKDVSKLRVGDTLTNEKAPAAEPLPGYKEVKPMVFAGLFPTDSDEYPELRDALERLKLNDAALFYEPETSQALGFGFRCGFLGLLHMEIVRERLEREFDLDLIVTAPNVAYRVQERNGDWVEVHNPADMPAEIEAAEEPYIKASVIVPKEYVGAVMELNNERRGKFDHMEYLSEERVHLTYELPLGEIVLDFYDQLKSRTRGYASFDYDLAGFRPGNLVRVDVLVGGEPVDALSLIVHRDFAYERGKLLVERLRKEIPRQMFDVAIQAAIGARIIARETVKARRKDVLAKCYGGDISRKRKLLEKQKKGKKRMKQVGGVEVPQEAFLAVLNLDERSK